MAVVLLRREYFKEGILLQDVGLGGEGGGDPGANQELPRGKGRMEGRQVLGKPLLE